MNKATTYFFLITLLLCSCGSAHPKNKSSSDSQAKLVHQHLSTSTESEDWQEQLQKYQQEIRQKTNQMNLHLAKAARAKDQGDRLQFQQDNLIDARRYWKIAEYHEQQAFLLQKEIQFLQQEKQVLLNKHDVHEDQTGGS